MLRLYGWLTPTNAWSSTSTLIRRSSCSSPATTSSAASRALADRSAAKAWPALPRTMTSNHSTPTPATSTSRSVGSSRTTASARWPARQAARVPLPVHSSSITARTARSPLISSGSTRCTASSASQPMAKPAFMSPLPRPYSQPSRRTGSKGGDDHCVTSPGGTTSMCPLNSSDGPSRRGSRAMTS